MFKKLKVSLAGADRWDQRERVLSASLFNST